MQVCKSKAKAFVLEKFVLQQWLPFVQHLQEPLHSPEAPIPPLTRKTINRSIPAVSFGAGFVLRGAAVLIQTENTAVSLLQWGTLKAWLEPESALPPEETANRILHRRDGLTAVELLFSPSVSSSPAVRLEQQGSSFLADSYNFVFRTMPWQAYERGCASFAK